MPGRPFRRRRLPLLPPSRTEPGGRSPVGAGLVLGAVMGVGFLDQQVVTPLIAALAAGFGVAVPDIGFAISAYAVSASVAALFVGPLADARGRRPFLLGAVALLFGASVLTATSGQYAAFLLARAAAGVAGGAISALAVAWMADRVRYRRRGRAMALVVGGAMGAAIVGQVTASFVAGRVGHRTVYLGLAGFAALVVVLLALLREEPRPETDRNEGAPPAGWGRSLGVYLEFARISKHRIAAFAGFFLSGSLVGVSAYAAGWLQEARGFSLEQVGLLYGAFGLAVMAAQPVAGPLSDRFGKRAFAVATSLGAVAVTLLLPHLAGVWLVLALLLFGCLAVARIGAFAALRSELVAPGRRAAFLAFSNTFSQLGIAAAAGLGGALYPAGFSFVCLAMAVFGVLAAGLLAAIPEPEGHSPAADAGAGGALPEEAR